MAKLIVHDGDRTVLVDLRPGQGLVLGRSADCDLPVEAARASRHHAEIVGAPDGHRLKDLGSTNGTLLNGTPLVGEPVLADGDVIDVGGCRVLYRS